jgi:hypothetical protein
MHTGLRQYRTIMHGRLTRVMSKSPSTVREPRGETRGALKFSFQKTDRLICILCSCPLGTVAHVEYKFVRQKYEHAQGSECSV